MTTTIREDKPEAAKSGEFVEALAKGLAILGSFDAAHPEMSLSDVARRVGLSPAAARRSLLTLKALGYIGQTGKRFHLRPKVMSFGSAFYFSARVDEMLLPELRNLVGTFGDASSVATLEGHDVLYVAHYSEQRARRPTATVGARYPAHATSLGRVLLASMPDCEFDEWLESCNPVALTRKTVVDKGELRAIVAEVRERNYSTTVDQLDYGITALAVPIRGSSGRTVAALNSSGYTGLLTAEALVEDRLQELRVSAARLGQSIARYPILESILAIH